MKLKDIPEVMLGKKEARFNKSETQWSINLVEANACNQSQEEQGEVEVELDREKFITFMLEQEELQELRYDKDMEDYMDWLKDLAGELSNNLPSILKVKK